MKINLNIPFRSFGGNPITEEGKEVIMADFIGKALFGIGSGIERKDMLIAYNIMRAIQKKPDAVNLKSEDITFLKEHMSKVLNVGCYGQLVSVLEGNE